MAKKDSNKSTQDVSKKVDSERAKALDAALMQIEKQFGKGAVMRLGEQTGMVVDVVPTGALTLDIALGVPSGTWAKYQAEYDDYTAILEELNGITDEEFSILKAMKDIVDYFLKIGIMHNHCGDTEKVIQLRQVLCVNSLTVIPKITYSAAYRAQVKTSTKATTILVFMCLFCFSN